MVDATPIKGRASKLRAGRILSDGVMFFEDIAHVVSMAVFDIFNTNIIDGRDELNGAPFVASNTRGGGCMVEASCISRQVSRSLMVRIPDWGRP